MVHYHTITAYPEQSIAVHVVVLVEFLLLKLGIYL